MSKDNKAFDIVNELLGTLDKFAEAFNTQKEFNITISNKVLELEKKIEDIS